MSLSAPVVKRLLRSMEIRIESIAATNVMWQIDLGGTKDDKISIK